MSNLLLTQENLKYFIKNRDEIFNRITNINKENPILVTLMHDVSMSRNISDIKIAIIKRYVNDNFSDNCDIKSISFLNEDGNIKYIDFSTGLRFGRFSINTHTSKTYLSKLDQDIIIKKIDNNGTIEICNSKDEDIDLGSYIKNHSLPENFLEWEEEHLTLLKMSL